MVSVMASENVIARNPAEKRDDEAIPTDKGKQGIASPAFGGIAMTDEMRDCFAALAMTRQCEGAKGIAGCRDRSNPRIECEFHDLVGETPARGRKYY